MKKPEDIVNKVAAELPFSKKLIKEVVNKTFRNIDERMKNKENIMLRGFMKFVCASDKKTKTYSMDEYKRLKTKDK
jgi:nucleoid DNA-binding protein|tara:strand:- start:2192 stop:2419 length:228 start_codon:yes stop_codon:yes gene_type:complete